MNIRSAIVIFPLLVISINAHSSCVQPNHISYTVSKNEQYSVPENVQVTISADFISWAGGFDAFELVYKEVTLLPIKSFEENGVMYKTYNVELKDNGWNTLMAIVNYQEPSNYCEMGWQATEIKYNSETNENYSTKVR